MAKINETDIKKLMEALDLTREEAIDMIEFDNGDNENEEVDKIDEKVKEVAKADKPTKKKGSSLDKVKNQKAKKKVDAIKEQLMNKISAMLDLAGAKKPQLMTSSKITFTVNGEYYSISLTKHKEKPDGYSEE